MDEGVKQAVQEAIITSIGNATTAPSFSTFSRRGTGPKWRG